MKHHYPNCDLGDRCNCQEIDEKIDDLEEDSQHQLRREIRRLQSENDLLKVKLTVAIGAACEPNKDRGEYHHRAFESLCPIPPEINELKVNFK
jgi:hypothetical protein